nr:MAG: hypothetical protein [Bacteriophage sp.]
MGVIPHIKNKDMTTYIYKGQKISHSKILSLLRSAGIYGGNKLSYYEVLVKAAENGNERATCILRDLKVI